MTTQIIYPEPIENAIASIESWLQNWGKSSVLSNYSVSKRSLALLLLQKDPNLWQALAKAPQQQQEIEILLTVAQNQLQYPVDIAIATTRQQQASSLESITIEKTQAANNSVSETLHRLTVNPLTGFAILLVILYFGIYKFVGEFGAGELVDRKVKKYSHQNLDQNEMVLLGNLASIYLGISLNLVGQTHRVIRFDYQSN